MLRGIYTGASGMIVQMHKMDAVANNMANVDLIGYKRDYTANKAFPELMMRRLNTDIVERFPVGSVDKAPYLGKLGTGVELNEVYTDFQQGSLRETENPFDVALSGTGFFCVQTPQGERYTRNGSFTLNDNGLLVNKDGLPVMGENGYIYLKLNNFRIDADGTIYHNPRYADDPNRLVTMRENDWEEEEVVDRLRVVDFEEPRYLRKQGNSLWIDTEYSGAAQTVELGVERKVHSGFLETSNVNSVEEMVKMIELNRAYEANQKSLQAHDSLADKMINDVMRR